MGIFGKTVHPIEKKSVDIEDKKAVWKQAIIESQRQRQETYDFIVALAACGVEEISWIQFSQSNKTPIEEFIPGVGSYCIGLGDSTISLTTLKSMLPSKDC